MATTQAVSAIVVNYRQREKLRVCLASLAGSLARVGEPTELLVVDNGSGDGSTEAALAAAPGATLVELPENLGFAGGVSEGIRRARGEWILLVNNDVEVEPAAVPALLAAARTGPAIGSVAAQLRFTGDRAAINSAGIAVDRLGIGYDRRLGEAGDDPGTPAYEVFGTTGGAGLLRRAMLDDVGGFDESFFFAQEDADLAWRAQMRGWRCLYVPAAVMYHHHGSTARHGSDLKYFHVGLNRVRMLAKNADAAQLRRYGALILAYDLGYVLVAALTDRTLAPLRGRLQGIREWRRYRRRGAARRPVELAPVRGVRAALGRRAVWLRSTEAGGRGA